ncbi:pentapeptide repeat-containing protein [Kibdelosporangium aridum]|uniref:pentapeptide repeat-containing protein n=1 Tax=Kibdelosporangium aridum TaxID=2030 RepID=UPI000F77D5E1|nr:pentapeptide repeat-containing protein [Kibdelosporangium aridum]
MDSHPNELYELRVSRLQLPYLRRKDTPATVGRRPLRALRWWVVLVGVVAVAAATWAATGWLLAEADQGILDKRAELRMAAIRTGLAVGAGTGAALGLLLAARRQWLSERAQAHHEEVAVTAEFDATERRITDLYTKAIDQLGSERAPIRLGGLYALERLAQNHPGHRQTVVDVLCAYLRMPYVPPEAGGRTSVEETPLVDAEASSGSATQGPDALHPVEEFQVRLTAERILTTHLRDFRDADAREKSSADPRFWEGMFLDLRDATLVSWDWTSCRIDTANFTGARFTDGANFAHATFDRDVWFNQVQFDKYGHFYRVRFGRRVLFTQAHSRRLNFKEARFCGMTWLSEVSSDEPIELEDARALLDFNTGWGFERQWPPGWTVSNENVDLDSSQSGCWGLLVFQDVSSDPGEISGPSDAFHRCDPATNYMSSGSTTGTTYSAPREV